MKKHIVVLTLILLLAACLRLFRLNEVPVSLFGDELDVGYHAYSILITGKDYYGNPWPLHFHSLAEYRTPLYLYSAVPTVAIFGISPFGVRLPAVIFGVLGVLGMYLLVQEILKTSPLTASVKGRSSSGRHNSQLGLIAAFLLAISPWHLQYSRAAFEVTMLLCFLIFGLYFFFKSLKQPKYLLFSTILLTFTPWIYSTAKLFTPILMLFLFLVWRKAILKLPKKNLVIGLMASAIVGLPIAYSTLFGGGAQRASHLSVFTDPTNESQIGYSRLSDALVRGDVVLGYQPKIIDRLFHNKFELLATRIVNNYFQTFSSDFLFVNGDPNPRHSIDSMGMFYKVEAIALLLGIVLFFFGKLDRRIKVFILFWLLIGAFPSEITRDGGNHATRLILILPPLLFLIAFGVFQIAYKLKRKLKYFTLIAYCLLLTTSFVFYLHNYYVHNPWFSERWWHAGFGEAIQTIKSIDKNYDKVIISMKGEPVWIFFAGWYMYPPADWQAHFPIDNKIELTAFGNASHINKFYFGYFSYPNTSIYDLGKFIDNKTLYMALANEIGANLITEPERTPSDLVLVKSIPYPSGEPAFYLFTRK